MDTNPKIRIFKYKEIPEKCKIIEQRIIEEGQEYARSLYKQCVIDEEGLTYIRILDRKNPEKDKYEIFYSSLEDNEIDGIHLMCPCGCKSFNVYNEWAHITIRCVLCGIAYLGNAERENQMMEENDYKP